MKGNNANNGNTNSDATGKTVNDTPPANGRRKSFDNEHTIHSANNEAHANNASEKANNISGAYLQMGIATAGERIRESIKMKTGFSSKKNAVYAEGSDNYHNNVIDASVKHQHDGSSYKYIEPVESSTLHHPAATSTGNVPSGKIKNSNLTTNAVKQIDLVSPIEAWEKQPTSSSLSTKNPSNGASFSSKHKPAPKPAVIDASTLPVTHAISANTNTTLGAHAYANLGAPVSSIGLNAPSISSKVHRSSGSSKKFDTVGFSTKGNSSIKVRPTIGEEEEDVNGSFGGKLSPTFGATSFVTVLIRQTHRYTHMCIMLVNFYLRFSSSRYFHTAEADYTSSTRKSNRRSFGAEDNHFGNNNNMGTGATAGTLSTKYEHPNNHNSSFSSKDGASKKSRRRSVA